MPHVMQSFYAWHLTFDEQFWVQAVHFMDQCLILQVFPKEYRRALADLAKEATANLKALEEAEKEQSAQIANDYKEDNVMIKDVDNENQKSRKKLARVGYTTNDRLKSRCLELEKIHVPFILILTCAVLAWINFQVKYQTKYKMPVRLVLLTVVWSTGVFTILCDTLNYLWSKTCENAFHMKNKTLFSHQFTLQMITKCLFVCVY